MPQALPFLSLGLGAAQIIGGISMQNKAIAAAKEPRLSNEAVAGFRKQGTSNIGANLASRGLMDSSLYTGGLAGLEKRLAEAQAGAGTMGNAPEMLWQSAMGMGKGGSETLGNLAEAYMMNRILGNQQQASPQPWMQQPPLYNPSMYTPPYSPLTPDPNLGYYY